ncbi:hypothetical protein ACGE0T_14165 [Parabacteroides sp. APC149_11_2_Y6]
MDEKLEIAAATKYPAHTLPVAECSHKREGFIAGVEWQRQHSYTEEQIKQAILDYCDENGMDDEEAKEFVDDFINNFLNTKNA